MSDNKGRVHLIERYPQLFDIDQPGYGLSDLSIWTGPGWDGIIAALLEQLISIHLPSLFRMRQIKEDYGSLRVYHNGEVGLCGSLVELFIAQARHRSVNTCEACEQPGSLADLAGRVFTRCASCLQREREK